MFLDRDRNNSMRPYMANSRYVIFFKFLVCRNIVSEGMHQSEVIISYILILREIRNVLRGNKCDIQWLCWVYQFHRLAPFSLVSSYSWHLILIKQLTPKHKWFISVLRVERKRPTLLVFYCPCHKHLFQVRQIVRFSWKLQDKWWNNFNEISTHLTTHHNQTHLKLFRTQWTLIRPAETWPSLVVGLMKIDYNIREIPLLPVKCLKRIKSYFTCFICMLVRFLF